MAIFWKRRASDDTVCVHRAVAHVDDAAAFERLLRSLPEASELRPRLRRPFFARAWQANSRRDYWISSDGSRVECFTLDGLTLQQAASVRVRWDTIRGRSELSERVLADLIASETGRGVTLLD